MSQRRPVPVLTRDLQDDVGVDPGTSDGRVYIFAPVCRLTFLGEDPSSGNRITKFLSPCCHEFTTHGTLLVVKMTHGAVRGPESGVRWGSCHLTRRSREPLRSLEPPATGELRRGEGPPSGTFRPAGSSRDAVSELSPELAECPRPKGTRELISGSQGQTLRLRRTSGARAVGTLGRVAVVAVGRLEEARARGRAAGVTSGATLPLCVFFSLKNPRRIHRETVRLSLF